MPGRYHLRGPHSSLGQPDATVPELRNLPRHFCLRATPISCEQPEILWSEQPEQPDKVASRRPQVLRHRPQRRVQTWSRAACIPTANTTLGPPSVDRGWCGDELVPPINVTCLNQHRHALKAIANESRERACHPQPEDPACNAQDVTCFALPKAEHGRNGIWNRLKCVKRAN